eukprot:scaffold5780_cov102-Cylindrotheca_fusiformis.AAC.3
MCVGLGLEGECCPTTSGLILDCCESSPVNAPTNAPVPNPTNAPVAAGPESCSANPVCAGLGLEGECCPTTSGLILDCCDSSPVNAPTNAPVTNPPIPPLPIPTLSPVAPAVQAQCASNSVCASLGLEGQCCPTTEGVTLDCCNPPVQAQCESNPVCASLGLEGQCCPTTDGVTLDCCNQQAPSPSGPPAMLPSLKPTQNPTLSTQCSANAVCANLGLEGECCPTIEGIFLDCCTADSGNAPSDPPSVFMEPECSANEVCADLQLDGLCCPTVDGVMLACCNAQSGLQTSLPSDFPSAVPSFSTLPSNEPTGLPSAAPTISQSDVPSQVPSTPPSENPSIAVSEVPSGSPSLSFAPTFPAECSENQECAALGLTGLCCPTIDNVILECCNGEPSSQPTFSVSLAPSDFPSQAPSESLNPSEMLSLSFAPTSSSECSENQECKALGLTGLCCPTIDNVFVPSEMPSALPSEIPGGPMPTEFPTEAPSELPSEAPSEMPSQTPSTSNVPFVNIGTITFDDLSSNVVLTTYRGLIWTNFKTASSRPQAPPSPPLAAVPTSTTASVRLPNGIFSLISIDIAGQGPRGPVIIRGFDSDGVQTISKEVEFIIVSFETKDLSGFENLSRLEFEFKASNIAAIDNWVFA